MVFIAHGADADSDLAGNTALARIERRAHRNLRVRTTFNTGQRRISRKITVGISTVRYENHYSARA